MLQNNTNTKIVKSFTDTNDAFIVSDEKIQVARGALTGKTGVNKFGANPDVGTSMETIWSCGGLYDWAGVDAAEGIVKLSSGSVEDIVQSQVETATIVGTITTGGNATITVTSALVTGSPLAISVAVAIDDTASDVAGKVRTALDGTTAITDHYTVSGATDKVILTVKVIAEDDTTLNIASDNDTCAGLTAQATSTNTTKGSGSGAWTATIYGLSTAGVEQNETLTLNGQTGVNSTKSYSRVNRIKIRTAGSSGAGVGIIYVGTGTITTGVPAVIWACVDIGMNQTLLGIYTVPTNKTFYVTNILLSTNSNKGAKLYIFARPSGEVFQVKDSGFVFDSPYPLPLDFPLKFESGTDIDVRAIATAVGGAFGVRISGWLEE